MRKLLAFSTLLSVSSLVNVAAAQTQPIAAPPPEAKAMVTGPKLGEAPKVEKASDDTTSISVR